MVATLNTEKVRRRNLRLDSVDEALAEGRRIAEAERSGTAQYAGNWTAGQILNHLGAWGEYAYGGNPIQIPWFLRLMGPMLLRRFLKKGLPAGHRIPKVPGGTLVTERVSADQGLDRFEKAFTRLKNEAPPGRHPLFGPMSHDQWIGLNLRHAELHMSFVKLS